MEITFFNLPHLSLNRGGEKWIKEVASYLSARHQVTVITTDYMKFNDIENLKFNYITLKFKRKMIFLNDISEIKDYIKNSDVVYAFYVWAGTQRSIISSSSRVIFGHHSNKDSPLQRIYYKFLELNRQIKNTYHHFLTEYRANIYRKKGFQKLFIVPNFVNTERYLLGDKNTDKFKVVSPGVTSREKGIDILFHIAEVLKGYKDIEFYVTGRRIDELQAPINVRFLGLLPEDKYIEIISNSNLMVLPTRAEAFPFSTLENLAVGNPVVVSNLPDVMSAFGKSDAIYYAKMNDSVDFISGILKYYRLWKTERERYLEISKRARELALHFDSKLILPKIEEMFKAVYEL